MTPEAAAIVRSNLARCVELLDDTEILSDYDRLAEVYSTVRDCGQLLFEGWIGTGNERLAELEIVADASGPCTALLDGEVA